MSTAVLEVKETMVSQNINDHQSGGLAARVVPPEAVLT